MTYPAPCPHLAAHGTFLFHKTFSCWDHASVHNPGGLALGSSSANSLMAAVPHSARRDEAAPDNGTHCGTTAIQPQYRYFFIACKQYNGTVDCSDFKIDCPGSVSEDIWWTSIADTLYASDYTTNESVTGYFETNLSAPDYQPVHGRTVHALVNVYEDVNSTAKFGFKLSSYICLGRTKVGRNPEG